MPDRRDVLKMAGLAGLGCGAPLLAGLAPAQDQSPSLRALAEARGMRFGSAVSAHGGGGVANPDYTAVLLRECDLVVPENEMKWQALRPSEHAFAFDAADRIVAFAAANGLAVRGHNLLWNRPKWQPAWLNDHDFGVRPAGNAAALLTDHIITVCTRYKAQIASWDVVNETVLPEDGSLVETAISRAIGGTIPTLDLAFRTARAVLPGAQLVYNDYMSWERGNAAHRNGVLRLLEALRKAGTPVDALGVQSHLVAGDHNIEEREWRAFLDEVTGMGYGLLITEFDVRDRALPRDPARRDAAVAAVTRSYFDMMLAYRQVRDVLVWGLCDRFSWLQGFEPRPDGAAARGCPYDEAFAAKPMRAALAAAIQSAPAR